ncbi:MAG TPA: hypothetical protein VIM70_02240 [Clostridium sp.]|uniref:hypothetical protein n=1 Tax=Clostridium sp. TaxID=1506 RepID=UPI002F923177
MIELENEIEELSISYTIEIYGDYEGLFYKRQIGHLLETLNELYNKVHNIFAYGVKFFENGNKNMEGIFVTGLLKQE